jgi:Tol biopolymer transport system component
MSHRRRIPRFILVTAGLFFTLEAITGGLLGLVRATHRHYVCLSFYPGHVINVNSGLDLVDRRQLPGESSQPEGIVSPDGRYTAFKDFTEPGKPRLVAKLLSSNRTPSTLEDTILIGPIYYINEIGWSPAAPTGVSRIAYAWTGKDQHLRLTVADLSERGLLKKTVMPLSNPLRFARWSPDGAYLVFSVAGENTVRLLGMNGPEVNFPLTGSLRAFTWAPDNHQFAYVDVYSSSRLVIAAPDIAPRILDLRRPVNDSSLSWSPDGRFVALISSSDYSRQRIDVFGVDGLVFNVANVARPNAVPSDSLVYWSADGQALYYMQDRTPSTWDWRVFYPDQNRRERVAADLLIPPAFAPGSQTGQQNVAVMDSDGAHRTMLAENADDAGNPYWSPDGQFAAAVWATGQQATRVVRLSITRQDGSGLLVLDDHFWDVRDLRWSSDGKALAFVAWCGDAQGKPFFSAEVIDLQTGQHRQLAGGFVQISMFAADQRSGGITFWWRMADGQIGADAYQPDGTRLYRFRADASLGASIDGQIFQTPYWTAFQPGSPQVFLAPDGSSAALKLGPPGNESLQLASPDGTWTRLIRSGLSGLGDPLWAPDGRMLAFTQSVNSKPITLSVIRADGSLVQDINRFVERYADLTWTKCD